MRNVKGISVLLVLIALTACAAANPAAETPANQEDHSSTVLSPLSPNTATEDQSSVTRDSEAPAGEDADEQAMPTQMPSPMAEEPAEEALAGAPAAIEPPGSDGQPDTMIFQDYGTNPFVDTSADNLSTFAVDVDTGAHSAALGVNTIAAPGSTAGRTE